MGPILGGSVVDGSTIGIRTTYVDVRDLRERNISREAVLARTLVELADTLVDDFDVVDLLTTLSDRCVEVLDIAAAGIMLVAPEGVLRAMASSSGSMLEQAKGMIAQRLQIEGPVAFDRMLNHARHRNRGLADVATAITNGALHIASFDSPRR